MVSPIVKLIVTQGRKQFICMQNLEEVYAKSRRDLTH